MKDLNKDRRVKLSADDRLKIKIGYHYGMSVRAIARQFGVDKRTIQFILFPEKLEENKKLREERGGWKQYYDKDQHKEAVKKTRRYKQSVIKGD